MKQFKTLFYILLYASPFINLSLINNLGMPLAYILSLFCFIILILSARTFPRSFFRLSDFFFIGLICSLFITLFINNGGNVFTPGFKQIVNILLSYMMYKTALLLLIKGEFNGQYILSKTYRYYTYVIVGSLFLYLLGYASEPLLRVIITVFNNSNNFDMGGVTVNRMTGFSPEPSFWSFFIAVNISLGLIVEKPKKWMMVVNILCLLLTIGRTGYLIGVAILIIKFWKGGFLQKALLVITGVAAVIYFLPLLNITFLMSVDDSFYQRFESLFIAANLVRENPFIGIGIGNFPIYAKAEGLDFVDIFNLYLYLMVGSGALGLLFFLAFLFSFIKETLERYRMVIYATIIGWLTVSAYNLPYVWVIFGILVYLSKYQVLAENNKVQTT